MFMIVVKSFLSWKYGLHETPDYNKFYVIHNFFFNRLVKKLNELWLSWALPDSMEGRYFICTDV